MSDSPVFVDFCRFFLGKTKKSMPFKKFLCFSEVFRSTLSEVWILIWLRWWWNKILDSVRKNTLISSNWPYVPHLLLERLNRLKKNLNSHWFYNQNFSDIELFNSWTLFSALSYNTISGLYHPVYPSWRRACIKKSKKKPLELKRGTCGQIITGNPLFYILLRCAPL